jgi:hypothetical protein
MKYIFIIFFIGFGLLISPNVYSEVEQFELYRNPFKSPLKIGEESINLEMSLMSITGAEEIIDKRLTGIVRSNKGISAIVDRKLVRLGEMLDDKKVILIGKNKVVLRKNNKKYIIRLKSKGFEL